MRSMILIAVCVVVGACGDSAPADSSEPTPAAAATEGEQGAVYECPMHCKLDGRDAPYTQVGPGQCPVCGMALEPQPEP